MKRNILLSFCLLISYLSKAQSITDTVSTGASYANQVWYSLENGIQGSSAKDNWDIAFDASTMGMTILINSVTGTSLWNYPKADTSGWETLDTSGIRTWATRWNADTSWESGAFERYLNPSDPYDAGWGGYNSLTHYVTGDSIFVIKLANGTYKKLWIKMLAAGTYTFRHAAIDGESDTTEKLDKSAYSGKNFVYFSLQSNTILDREPVSASWDLLFGQYTTFIPSAYSVTGVLTNKNRSVAKATQIGDPDTYNQYSQHIFNTQINQIGYDWKKFVANEYAIDDSLVYFIKDSQAGIWKIIFKGFGGSANGNFIFTKEKLSTTSIKSGVNSDPIQFSLYPNPSSGRNLQVLYDFGQINTTAFLSLYDLSGKEVFSQELERKQGLQTLSLNIPQLSSGLYIISIKANGLCIQQKLILQ